MPLQPRLDIGFVPEADLTLQVRWVQFLAVNWSMLAGVTSWNGM